MLVLLKGKKLFPLIDGSYLLKFEMFPKNKKMDIPISVFYQLSNIAEVLPGNILKAKRLQYYFIEHNFIDIPFSMPYSRSLLTSITKEGRFFTAWTEDFLIKAYDRRGNYEYAFYYPIQNSSLTFEKLHTGKEQQKALRKYDYPDTWPVLHTMELDNSEKLWISTITESDASYKWWILDNKGKLLAKFTMPDTKAKREPVSKPLILIKNGYFYFHERDFDAGIDRIVKYKIVFKER